MKSSQAISRVRYLCETDVLRTILVIITRLMMMTTTEMVLKMSVSHRYLTWLIAQEDFIKFSHHESS